MKKNQLEVVSEDGFNDQKANLALGISFYFGKVCARPLKDVPQLAHRVCHLLAAELCLPPHVVDKAQPNLGQGTRNNFKSPDKHKILK